jgi:hypothetical protein
VKLAIMQPYFFPYLGYFQLINSVDTFVIYDNIEFTKSGWIRRNRILNGNRDRYIIIPLKKASDYSRVCDLQIAKTYDFKKMLRIIRGAYERAPYFNHTYQLLKNIIPPGNYQLFDYLLYITKSLCAFFEIQTKFIISSSIRINHSLKAQEKVIALCRALNADEYVNPSGGKSLYDKRSFSKSGIKLSLHRMSDITYGQFKDPFLPNLSIIDVMMFNSKERIKKLLNMYTLS